jgi:hypothetical protein
MRFKEETLFKKTTVIATLLTFVALNLGFRATAFGQNQCRQIFEYSDVISSSIPTIKMSEQYAGENKGLYLDPLTKSKWKVIYFSEAEKKRFEVVYKNNLFWSPDGKKANSEFDSEALSFHHSLIVIDKTFKIFTLPFEERGKYHHSSLTSGEDILFAGTAAFSEGKLRELSDLSGHYKPTPEQTILILKELRRRGVDLSHLKVSGRISQVLRHTPMLMPHEVQELLNTHSF